MASLLHSLWPAAPTGRSAAPRPLDRRGQVDAGAGARRVCADKVGPADLVSSVRAKLQKSSVIGVGSTLSVCCDGSSCRSGSCVASSRDRLQEGRLGNTLTPVMLGEGSRGGGGILVSTNRRLFRQAVSTTTQPSSVSLLRSHARFESATLPQRICDGADTAPGSVHPATRGG